MPLLDPLHAEGSFRNRLITEVGRIDGSARRTIEADGLTVTPGFVDVHTQYDGQATWDPHLTPSCWHGVTTAVMAQLRHRLRADGYVDTLSDSAIARFSTC